MARKKTTAKPARRKITEKTLDELLDDIEVGCVVLVHREANPGRCPPLGWHFVADDDGVIAYFAKENDAFRFRLDLINRMLNP